MYPFHLFGFWCTDPPLQIGGTFIILIIPTLKIAQVKGLVFFVADPSKNIKKQ